MMVRNDMKRAKRKTTQTAGAWRVPLILTVLLLETAGGLGAASVPAEPGRVWSMEDLALERTIQEQHQSEILSRPGVVGMGITLMDEVPAFLIVVEKGQKPDLPDQIGGVRVVVEQSSAPRLIHGGDGCTSNTGSLITNGCHDDPYAKPVPMGASTSSILSCDAGTLGFKACDLATGKDGYVTAGHVATRQANGCEGAPIGTAQVHRGTFESYPACNTYDFTIGTLSKWIPVVAGSSSSPNLVDAAFVVSKNSNTSHQAIDIPAPGGSVGTPALNTCVKKSGRTSGVSYGQITAVNFATTTGGWCLGGGSQHLAHWGGLFRISYNGGVCGTCTDPPCGEIARGGDSGSAVVHRLLKGRTYGLLVFNMGGNAAGEIDGLAIPTSTILSQLGLGIGAQCQ